MHSAHVARVRSVSWWLCGAAAALGVALVAAPRAASACSPGFCEGWKSIEVHTSAPIPADGVIVLRASFGNSYSEPSQSSLSSVMVTVRGPDDAEIAGSLSLVSDPLALIWRPDAALSIGVTYSVAIVADNSGFGGGCGAPAMVESSGSVTVNDAALGPYAIPEVSAQASFSVKPSYQFSDVACCDGSEPYVGSCSPAEWGECASIRGTGEITATFAADVTALAAMGDQVGLVGFDLETGARVARSTSAAPCVTPTAIVFATGQTLMGAPVCAGEDLVAQLGPAEIDANAALATCEEPPVSCASPSDDWDPDACVPWDGWLGGGSATGCGCRGGSDGREALALAIGLLGLGARRRRGRARTNDRARS